MPTVEKYNVDLYDETEKDLKEEEHDCSQYECR
jgi:hypothetical protein